MNAHAPVAQPAAVAADKPLYFLCVERLRFESASAMCEAFDWPLHLAPKFERRAELSVSKHVLVDELPADPGDERMFFALFKVAGSIVFCEALMDTMCTDLRVLDELGQEMKKLPHNVGKLVMVGASVRAPGETLQ